MMRGRDAVVWTVRLAAAGHLLASCTRLLQWAASVGVQQCVVIWL